MSKTISVFVCGRFHYHYYVKYIDNRLGNVFYSYKLKYDMGLDRDKLKNLFIKEYLTGLHIKLIGRKYFNQAIKFYQIFWKIGLYLGCDSSDIGFFMLHGNCLPAIKKYKKNKKIVVGEAVNMHPLELRKLLNDESERYEIVCDNEIYALENKLEEIKYIDYLVCPSESVKDSYVRQGFNVSRCVVLPYGVNSDVNIGQGLKKNNTTIKVICVGQISVRKGQLRLFDALLRIKNSGVDFNLTLVGAADIECFEKINKYEIYFRHIKHLPHSSVKKYMAEADVLVLPSIEDGFGMVVTEALSVGTPVVVSKYAGSSEIVKKYGGGYVVDPYKADQMAEAIIKCSNGDYPKANRVYSWKNYADDLLKFFDEI